MPLARLELGFLEKPLMIHHYNYPFVSNTTFNKDVRFFINIMFLVSLWLNKITKTSERILDRLLGMAMQTFCQPYEGPAVLNFWTNQKEQILSWLQE